MSGFDLKRPCKHCPFREDIEPYLPEWRAEEIANSLRSGATFPCHKTTAHDEDSGEAHETRNSQFCAGALIVLELGEEPNQMMRIGERLGLYDHKKLDMESPVYSDLNEFVYAPSKGGRDE